jgi:phosphoribosylanthranilate isomerase
VRVRAKICGITSIDDAQCAVECGADAIGLILWPRSPRAVDAAAARRISASVAPFVSVVALLVNADADDVRRVIDEVRPHLLQFHGDEREEFCASFGVPYMKAVKMRNGEDATSALTQYPSARALLLDSFDPQRVGGTGQVFDWRMIPRQRTRPVILAGGLDAANVGRAIAEVRPFAVDVSSGVEAAPGRKDHAAVAAFLQAVALANETLAREGCMTRQNRISA